jgi:hypothetical protein
VLASRVARIARPAREADMNCPARIALVIVILSATGTAAQQAQTPRPAAPPPSFEQSIANTWKAIHNKILVMAQDFPEDKYGWKPHADSRTMVDEFRHVTIGLEMSAAQLKGAAFDYNARVKADETKPKTRASVVAEMEAAIAASYPLVESSPKPSLVFWIDHQAEHYGKLVSNYRINGLVPPISRPRR